MLATLRPQLLEWYGKRQRPLPWRQLPTPYRVWLSEIMLQQTQVQTVIPFFERFTSRFNDFQQLARAREEEVLELWSGLGYYRRARALLATARQVVGQYNGQLPGQAQELQRLPGIGPYTANAIASIAFGQVSGVVDGNVARVVSRLLAWQHPVNNRQLQSVVDTWVDPQQPGDFNQAMMELGATVCLPRQPDCPNCPLNMLCEARRLNIAASLPVVKKPSAAVILQGFAALCILNHHYLLLTRDAPAPLSGTGLWNVPVSFDAQPQAWLQRLQQQLGWSRPLWQSMGRPTVQHAITVHRLRLAPLTTMLSSEALPELPENFRWQQLDAAPGAVSGLALKMVQVARALSKSVSANGCASIQR